MVSTLGLCSGMFERDDVLQVSERQRCLARNAHESMFFTRIVRLFRCRKRWRDGDHMNSGRFPYNMRKRSVIAPMKKYGRLSEEFAQNYDCASAAVDSGCAVAALTAGPICKFISQKLMLNRVCNVIYSRGAKVRFVNASIIWKPDVAESECRAFTEELAHVCAEQNITLGAVTQGFSWAANSKCILSLQALGEIEKNGLSAGASAGQTIVMAGSAGAAGTAVLAQAEEVLLKARFTSGFIDQAKKFSELMSVKAAVSAAGELAATAYPLAEGGVLAALWNWADGAGLGLDADQLSIPISQETVEITETLKDINPYTLASDGACLFATNNAEELLERLRRAGIPAAVIGSFNCTNAKILRRNDEVRYIDKPTQDGLEMLAQREWEAWRKKDVGAEQ